MSQLPYLRFPIVKLRNIYPHFLSESDHVSIDPGRSKTRCEILYVHSGTLRWTQNGTEHIYPEGSVITFAHNSPLIQQASGKYEEYFILFFLENEPVFMTEEELQKQSLRPQDVVIPHEVRDPAVCRKIAELMKRIYWLKSGSALTGQLQIRARFMDILTLLMESTGAALPAADSYSCNTYCRDACVYIEDTLHRKISVDDVAHHVGLSSNYLCRLFREEMRLSVITYINSRKVHRARELIIRKGYTTEAAAHAVGISDGKYLGRLFRQHTGMTISEYQRWWKNRALSCTE